MERNLGSQLVHFEAIDTTTGNRRSGDAANIIPYCQIDSGSVNSLSSVTVTEWSAAKTGTGIYYMQPSSAEATGRNILYFAISSTPNTRCIPVGAAMNADGFSQSMSNGALLFGVVCTQNNDKVGYALSSAGITAIWAATMEGAYTAVQYMRGFASMLFGRSNGLEGPNPNFRDTGDTKNRVSGTDDANGNRSAVTLDLT